VTTLTAPRSGPTVHPWRAFTVLAVKPARHQVATATPRNMTWRVRPMCAVAAFELEGATDPGAGRPAKGFSQQQRRGTAATARDLAAARRLVPRLPTVIRTRTDFKREVLV
jgi:hypothetical protein